MTVIPGQTGDFVERIINQLTQMEAPRPIVISPDSPSLEIDTTTVVDKAMDSSNFPSEFKLQNLEYYIWVNVDEVLEKGFVASLSRVSKYLRCIFIFDHKLDWQLIPYSLKYALGAECEQEITFNPFQSH